MSAVRIDGRARLVEFPPETWGDLLRAVDGELAGGGRIVTAIRIDGVDQPAFRDPTVLGQTLPGGVVDIESGTHASLIATTLTEAMTGLVSLCEHLPGLARLFRDEHAIDASTQLGTVAESLATVLTIGAAAALGLGVDLQGVQCHGCRASELIDEIGRSLDALLEAQRLQDWVTVADVLEYELTPALQRWGGVFDALQNTLGEVA
jgi:hypothetical protein